MREIFNEFTTECNKHLTPDQMSVFDAGYNIGTYLLYDERDFAEGYLVIRVPGATRGYVKFEDNTTIIKEIGFHSDTSFRPGIGCYLPSVKEVIPKWIGKELKITKPD